ncbi:MAG: hypothetical protein IH853_13840 [Bacteroidetes bacterium]|nr:hypothetical protein [Bacteroidota bacterium]
MTRYGGLSFTRKSRDSHAKNKTIYNRDTGTVGTEWDGTLEEAVNLANLADMRTTRIYDKRDRVIRRTQVERVVY